uniref:Uncharacterized protein n=1 Tax=Bracon brevicornis TaxID=1563983 RepID=A0A6V7JIA2_9HYME
MQLRLLHLFQRNGKHVCKGLTPYGECGLFAHWDKSREARDFDTLPNPLPQGLIWEPLHPYGSALRWLNDRVPGFVKALFESVLRATHHPGDQGCAMAKIWQFDRTTISGGAVPPRRAGAPNQWEFLVNVEAQTESQGIVTNEAGVQCDSLPVDLELPAVPEELDQPAKANNIPVAQERMEVEGDPVRELEVTPTIEGQDLDSPQPEGNTGPEASEPSEEAQDLTKQPSSWAELMESEDSSPAVLRSLQTPEDLTHAPSTSDDRPEVAQPDESAAQPARCQATGSEANKARRERRKRML